MQRTRLGTIAALLAALLVLPALAHAQAVIDHIAIWNVDAVQFPEVRVTFRALDAGGRVVPDLDPADLTLYDGDTLIDSYDLMRHDDGPIDVIYVIDLGRYANYEAFGLEQIHAAITQLVTGGTFQDGVDSVEVLTVGFVEGVEQVIPLVEPTTDAEAFVSAVEAAPLPPGRSATLALNGVEEALARAEAREDPDQRPASIVLVTPFIDSLVLEQAVTAANEVGEAAKAAGVPVYVLQTDLGGRLPEPLQTLAESSGGQYLLLQPGIDQQAALGAIYGEMASQRTYHTAIYESPTSEPGARTVTLVPPGVAPSAADSTGSYTIDADTLSPPEVAITAPQDDAAISLEVITGAGGQPAVEPAALTVRAEVSDWPDGRPRDLASVELLVDGERAASITPEAGEERFTFDWALPVPDSVEAPAVQDATFRVRVVDDYGVEAESEAVTVHLTPQGVAPEVTEPEAATCREAPFAGRCLPLTVGAPLLAVLVLGGGVWLVLRRRSAAAPAPATPPNGTPARLIRPPSNAAPAPAGPPADEPEPTEAQPEHPLPGVSEAHSGPGLRVLEGPAALVGRTIAFEADPVRLGCNPEVVDVAFYPHEASSLSGLHCTLESFRGRCFVIDNNSTNGTHVNDETLEPGEARELEDGDTVVLGKLARGGVRLRYRAR